MSVLKCVIVTIEIFEAADLKKPMEIGLDAEVFDLLRTELLAMPLYVLRNMVEGTIYSSLTPGVPGAIIIRGVRVMRQPEDWRVDEVVKVERHQDNSRGYVTLRSGIVRQETDAEYRAHLQSTFTTQGGT